MLRPLGTTGIQTPPLVLGGNVFGWTADRATSFALLDAFVAGGGTLVDTADIYSAWQPGSTGGESEALIGAWRAANPGAALRVATKFGLVGRGGAMEHDLSLDHLHAALPASLARLRTDRIDLYYVHHDVPDVPLAPLLRALHGYVRSGAVAALGASNFTARRLAEAASIAAAEGLTPFSVLQPEYSLVERDFEASLQPWCVAQGVAVLPYLALAAGFLTGKYRSMADARGRAREARVKRYLNEGGTDLLAAMDALTAETGATHAQLALAWLAAQPAIAAPIASATTLDQLAELLSAMTLRLDPAQLATLTAAAPMDAAPMDAAPMDAAPMDAALDA